MSELLSTLFGAILKFLLVLVGFGSAVYWAKRRRQPKLVLIVAGSFVAWLVLPSLLLWFRTEMKFGAYEKSGEAMAVRLERRLRPVDGSEIPAATRLVAEVCGDAAGYDPNDPTLQTVSMPESATVQHRFFYGKYSNVLWLGVGWKERFCLARYHQTERYAGFLSPLPAQLFPYPLFAWRDDTANLESRLLERLLPSPEAAEGVRALLPGQCVTGEISEGSAARFQVEVPWLHQQIDLSFDLQCTTSLDHSSVVEFTKDGRPIAGWVDRSNSGGTYQITVRPRTSEPRRYLVGVFWGNRRCKLPEGWWIDCGPSGGDNR